jgi:predicted metal-dependent hydrolase
MTVLPNGGELNRGVDLFNRAHFFDAHEVLEDVWRSLPRDRPSCRHLRQHVQGLVQLAVAFHHASKDNNVGARSVLERALRNLNGADASFPDLDLDRLRIELAPWQRFMDDLEDAGAEAGTKARAKRDMQKDKKKSDGLDLRRPTAPALPIIVRRR